MKRALISVVLVHFVVAACPRILSAQSCLWRPWMSDWGHLDSYSVPDDMDPSNWDFAGVEPTVLAADGRAHGGSHALHFFTGNPVNPGNPSGIGSGGVYQQIMAVRGTPINVNLWWKGKSVSADSGGWFEVMIVEGPFTPQKADMSVAPGDLLLKYDTFTGPPWSEPPATWKNDSANWNNWSTSTPAEPTTVTVILKAGTVGGLPAYFEAYYDDVVVTQNGGPNLVTNGDFEDTDEVTGCDTLLIGQDPNRNNYYFVIPPPEECGNGLDDDEDGQTDCADSDCAENKRCTCNDPFADFDADGDVDMIDFAELQRCLTTGGGTVTPACNCFDWPEPGSPNGDGDIDDTDMSSFILCADGPNVMADPDCDE